MHSTQRVKNRIRSDKRRLELFVDRLSLFYNRPQVCRVAHQRRRSTVLRKNLASAKIVKIEFNASFYLLDFPHFITFIQLMQERALK